MNFDTILKWYLVLNVVFVFCQCFAISQMDSLDTIYELLKEDTYDGIKVWHIIASIILWTIFLPSMLLIEVFVKSMLIPTIRFLCKILNTTIIKK